MSNYQTADREDHCADCEHQRLIEDAEVWARKGERTFMHWYWSLSDEDRVAVKQHMNRREKGAMSDR